MPKPEDDPRERALRKIELSRTTVQSGKPFVFLFGGPIPSNGNAEVEPPSVRSRLLDFFVHKRPAFVSSLVVPEEFKDWLNDAVYPDLLSFEKDLVSTASLVVIALESPGSLAELGVFSADPALRQKMLIIVNTSHFEQDSFIVLGPLRTVNTDRNVLVFPFEYGPRLSDSLESHLPDIADSIEELAKPVKERQSFNVNDTGHVAFLVHELLVLFRALIVKDIREYLRILGVDLSIAEMTRTLFLLDKLGLVRKEKFGHPTYYLPTTNERRVYLAEKESNRVVDRTALELEVSVFYDTSPSQRKRKRFLSERQS